MYKLTLTAEGYNRISFIFDEMADLTYFLRTAMEYAEGEVKAEITLVDEEKEGEE